MQYLHIQCVVKLHNVNFENGAAHLKTSKWGYISPINQRYFPSSKKKSSEHCYLLQLVPVFAFCTGHYRVWLIRLHSEVRDRSVEGSVPVHQTHSRVLYLKIQVDYDILVVVMMPYYCFTVLISMYVCTAFIIECVVTCNNWMRCNL